MKKTILILLLGLLVTGCSASSDLTSALPASTPEEFAPSTQTEIDLTKNSPATTPTGKICPYNPPKPDETDSDAKQEATSTLSFQEIEENYANYPETAWNLFVNEIIGLRIHWSAVVMDVIEDTVSLELGQNSNFQVFLDGLPEDVINNLETAVNIEFVARVEKILKNGGLTIWLVEPDSIIVN